MSPQQIGKFVMGWCDQSIFTNRHAPARFVPNIFLPIRSLSKDTIGTIGLIWEWLSLSRSIKIHKYPIFTSCYLMGKEDWNICYTLIQQELDRRDNLRIRIQQQLNL